MIEKKLVVGQRIELYKVLTDGGYIGGVFTPGTIRPCIDFRSRYLVDLLGNVKGEFPLVTQPLTNTPQECRPVGAMIIKSLK